MRAGASAGASDGALRCVRVLVRAPVTRHGRLYAGCDARGRGGHFHIDTRLHSDRAVLSIADLGKCDSGLQTLCEILLHFLEFQEFPGIPGMESAADVLLWDALLLDPESHFPEASIPTAGTCLAPHSSRVVHETK